jgi:hypothetical protein
MSDIFDFETGASQSELDNYLNNNDYDFFADPRNDPFYHNDLGTSPSNSQILSDINYDPGNPNLLRTIGSILSGGSGTMAQLAGLGGLGALINKIGGSGGSGGGGFQGYQGGIPEYTASRTQLPIPPSGSQSATPDGQGAPKRRPGSGGVTYFSPMQYLAPGQAPAQSGIAGLPVDNSSSPIQQPQTPGQVPTGVGLASLVGGDPSNAPPSIAPPSIAPPTHRHQPSAILRDSLGAPIIRELVDEGNPFYQSPEYKAFQNDPSNMMGTNDMYMSPYFGQMSSGSTGAAMDRAFEQYRKRTSAPGMAVKPGQPTRPSEVAPSSGFPNLSKDEDFKPPMLTPEEQTRSIITDFEDQSQYNPPPSVLSTIGGDPRKESRNYIVEDNMLRFDDLMRDPMLSGLLRNPNSSTLTEVTPKEVNTPPEPRPELMRELMGVSNPRQYAQTYAQGGIANLGGYSDGGRLLRGPGDGVSDDIPATIGGRQPARLADGEFVVPARIVSELGNGSTEAGARKLYAMMDRIKASRAKAKNIAADTKASKHLPA